MKFNIVGKEHTEGTSKKTGKAYSLNIVYYTAAKTGVNGMIAERANSLPYQVGQLPPFAV